MGDLLLAGTSILRDAIGMADSVVSRAGGRRWTPVYWLAYEQAGEGLHSLMGFSGRKGSAVDPTMEYRLVFDRDRDMWRLDQRVHAPLG